MKNDLVCNVLMIDPVMINAIGMRAVFHEIIDLEVTSVQNCVEAIQTLKKKRFDLIFFEINNKGVLDVRSFFEIRKVEPYIRIIVFTDYENIEEIVVIMKGFRNCTILKKTASQEEIFQNIKYG
ncbi:response regulator [Flavobacterium sp. NRK F10]|uniref:response regulator n=1 Tax=Flavobacterium sp. NRK F10 TaxID=2954931 RepID=UPI0020903475|nr:response regulator [Flavobacterium sp. NRK F10]MCO6175406.1 response regulator [Flavobacterium sp. NRK F10]